jgi:hypothetical protein
MGMPRLKYLRVRAKVLAKRMDFYRMSLLMMGVSSFWDLNKMTPIFEVAFSKFLRVDSLEAKFRFRSDLPTFIDSLGAQILAPYRFARI